jgi:hypothetical protein
VPGLDTCLKSLTVRVLGDFGVDGAARSFGGQPSSGAALTACVSHQASSSS